MLLMLAVVWGKLCLCQQLPRHVECWIERGEFVVECRWTQLITEPFEGTVLVYTT